MYSEPDENQQQIDKQVGLVVQNCDGFVGSADLFQPVEIGHYFEGERSDVVAGEVGSRRGLLRGKDGVVGFGGRVSQVHQARMGRHSRAIWMDPAGKSYGEIVNVDEFEKGRGRRRDKTDGHGGWSLYFLGSEWPTARGPSTGGSPETSVSKVRRQVV